MIFDPSFFVSLSPARATASFPASWPLFAGHFPEKPIVPAYALIGLVLAHAEHGRGPLALTHLDRMKLARALGPDEPVTCDLEVEPQGAALKLRARLSTASGDVGTLVLSARVEA